MAITQVGSTLKFDLSGYGNTGTVSTTITVPADAELVIVGWSGFSSTANYFSGGGMTFTKGGVDTAMVAAPGGDANNAFWMAAAFYLALPDTGSNKTLKWDWAGAGGPTDTNGLCSVTFWKGINTSSPVRDTDGAQAATTPYTTPTLTAQSGDLIVAWVGAFSSAEGSVDSWSNLTLLGQVARNAPADGAWATGSPSGNTTVAASTDTNIDDGGIVAIVLQMADLPGASTGPGIVIGSPNSFVGEGAIGAPDSTGGITGTLSQTLGAATVAAAAQVLIQASLSRTLDAATVASAAKVLVQGTLARTLGDATLAAAGISTNRASAAITLDDAMAAAVAKVLVQAQLSRNLDAATVAAAGQVLLQASLSRTLDAATVASAAKVLLQGSVGVTLGDATLAAAGVTTTRATLAATLDAATAVAAAQVLLQASLSRTLDAATVASAAKVLIQGQASPSLAAATLAAVGATLIQGSVSATLGDVALSAAGNIVVKGTLDQSLADAVLASTSGVRIAAQVNTTLADAVLSAFGSGVDVRVGTVNVTLGDATAAGSARLTVGAAVSAVLEQATLTADGRVRIGATGSPTLDAATAAAVGRVLVQGSAAASVGNAEAVSAGRLLLQGLVARTLGDAVLGAEGIHFTPLQGQLDVTLAGATVAARGEVATLRHPSSGRASPVTSVGERHGSQARNTARYRGDHPARRQDLPARRGN